MCMLHTHFKVGALVEIGEEIGDARLTAALRPDNQHLDRCGLVHRALHLPGAEGASAGPRPRQTLGVENPSKISKNFYRSNSLSSS